jgi:DNA-binding LytR/AlgR family response regulator
VTTGPAPEPAGGLRVLVVDDEAPALSELAFLLSRDARVGHVTTAQDGATALRVLQDEPVDGVFLDVRMPGLTGLDLAKVLSRFRQAPPVVFVTAHDKHAVDAFELSAVDYLLKPVREERLAESVRRMIAARAARGEPAAGGALAPVTQPADDEVISVELAGVVRFVPRSEVRYVAARGDYARLFTADAAHLVRVPLSTLAERWRDAGFVQVHRSHLVSLRHIVEVRSEQGQLSVKVTGGAVLPVSRRHARRLRDLLVRARAPKADRERRPPDEGSP